MMTGPTPYPELNDVLRQMVSGIQLALGDNFLSACLQGSFAVGEFDEHSDVDFIVAVNEEMSDQQVADLQALHGRTYDLPSPWAQHLEGSYLPKAILRDIQQAGSDVWYLDHGSRSMIRSNHCNSILVRAVVRDFGVRLAGAEPATLVDPIPVDALRREILDTILTWGEEILADPEQYNNRFYQGFILLSYCRMPHDLLRGRPGSKRAGAAWAKTTLSPEWSGLIDRAWDCRPDPGWQVRQRADPEDYQQTLRFVAMMMEKSRELMAEFDQN